MFYDLLYSIVFIWIVVKRIHYYPFYSAGIIVSDWLSMLYNFCMKGSLFSKYYLSINVIFLQDVTSIRVMLSPSSPSRESVFLINETNYDKGNPNAWLILITLFFWYLPSSGISPCVGTCSLRLQVIFLRPNDHYTIPRAGFDPPFI